jgi:hypothetical protein
MHCFGSIWVRLISYKFVHTNNFIVLHNLISTLLRDIRASELLPYIMLYLTMPVATIFKYLSNPILDGSNMISWASVIIYSIELNTNLSISSFLLKYLRKDNRRMLKSSCWRSIRSFDESFEITCLWNSESTFPSTSQTNSK